MRSLWPKIKCPRGFDLSDTDFVSVLSFSFSFAAYEYFTQRLIWERLARVIQKSALCNLTCIMSYVRHTEPWMKCTTFRLALTSGIRFDLQKCALSNELRWTERH